MTIKECIRIKRRTNRALRKIEEAENILRNTECELVPLLDRDESLVEKDVKELYEHLSRFWMDDMIREIQGKSYHYVATPSLAGIKEEKNGMECGRGDQGHS